MFTLLNIITHSVEHSVSRVSAGCTVAYRLSARNITLLLFQLTLIMLQESFVVDTKMRHPSRFMMDFEVNLNKALHILYI